jgi:hypothetical protein
MIAFESESKDRGHIDRLTDAMSGLDRNDLAAMLKARVRLDVDAINDGAYHGAFPVYWCSIVDELTNLVPCRIDDEDEDDS